MRFRNYSSRDVKSPGLKYQQQDYQSHEMTHDQGILVVILRRDVGIKKGLDHLNVGAFSSEF
jgi:hypothetical protein